MMNDNPTTPVLIWQGGKRRMLKHLLPMIRPHTTYVEVFAGGAALLLAKPRSKVEVLNDLNQELVNMYRCARYHLEPLLQELEFMLCSRAELKASQQHQGVTDLQRAACFLHQRWDSFGGNGQNYAVSRKIAPASREARLELLRQLNQRLDKTLIECLPWQRCLALYDKPQTLFFCDPPYVDAKNGAYAPFAMTQAEELADALQALKGDWLLTFNDSPAVRKLFAGHEIKAVKTRNQTTLNAAGQQFSEIIIRKRRAASS